MKCFLTIVLGLLSMCVGQARAEGEEPAPEKVAEATTDDGAGSTGVSATLSFTFWSKYLSNSGGMVYLDRPVIQSDLNIGLPSDFYIDLWNSTGLNGGGFSSDFGDEFDITLGWNHTFADSGVAVDIGVSYFDILPVGTFAASDIVQPFITISREWEISEHQTVSPYVRCELLWENGGDPNGEAYVHTGISHSVTITEGFTFEQKADVCYDPGMFGLDAGFIGEYDAGFGLDLGAFHWDIIKGRISTPLESLDDDRGTELVFGCGVSIKF